MSFVAELKRRNVLRVAAAYLAGAWLLVQVADTVFPVYGLGTGALNALITVLAIGLPLALLLSWVFELTPEGLKRESDVDRSQSLAPATGKQLDRLIILLLTLALGYFAIDKFMLDPARDASMVEYATREARTRALLESYGEKSIAVLPFADMSPAKDQEYFADGISEELLNLLAKVPELRVISRTSAFTFKGQSVDIPTVAERLKVAHVLEGSVRKSGNQVRITAQLIDGRTDTHLWSETYDRELENVFLIQDEIAAAVVGQLEIELLGNQPTADSVDAEAYALFLQGRHFINRLSAEGYRQGAELLQKAIAIDPDFAPAWAELSRSFGNQAMLNTIDPEWGFAEARAAIEKADELDPENAVILSRLSWFLMMDDGDLAGAAELAARAMSLEPGNVVVLANCAILSAALGRIDQAIKLQKLAIERDPVAPLMHINLARGYIDTGRYDLAESSVRKALMLSPSGLGMHEMLARVLRLEGDYSEALQAVEQEPVPFLRLAGESMIHYAAGDRAASDKALQKLLENYPNVAPGIKAGVYAVRGQNDQAIEWLKKALESEGQRGIAPFKTAPDYKSLRQDPRVAAIFSTAGISKAQTDAIAFDIDLPTSAGTR